MGENNMPGKTIYLPFTKEYILNLLNDNETAAMILKLFCHDLSDKEIAELLKISIDQVHYHIKNLRKLLHAHTRAKLFACALVAGMVEVIPANIKQPVA
jgi:DNA-binding CsgD family transcriptional regulator